MHSGQALTADARQHAVHAQISPHRIKVGNELEERKLLIGIRGEEPRDSLVRLGGQDVEVGGHGQGRLHVHLKQPQDPGDEHQD